MLLEMSGNDRHLVFQLISDLKLNKNQQKQLTDYLFDLSHKKSMNHSRLINELGVKSLLLKNGIGGALDKLD